MANIRRARERELRRTLLLEAAERVFGRKPFQEASMHEVAAEAQIGMQGLYEHFHSKQVLYESLILHRVEEVSAILSEALKKVSAPLEQLRVWTTIHVERFSKAPAFFPVFLREKLHRDWEIASRFGPAINQLFDREEARVADMMERAVKARQLRPMDTSFLISFFLGVLQSSMRYHLREEPNEEVERCINRTMDCFLKGVGSAD